MLKESLKGAAIAAGLVSMFAANAAKAGDVDGHAKAGSMVVKCTGVNECKGKGACKGGGNDCKGKNACKGKGWVEMKTDKDCTDKKGSVVK
jgi:hypothetical protein